MELAISNLDTEKCVVWRFGVEFGAEDKDAMSETEGLWALRSILLVGGGEVSVSVD